MVQTRTRATRPGGTPESSRWWSESASATTGLSTKAHPPRRGDGTLHGPLHPIAPAGAGLILSSIRWFSLADSLHHRLISAAPPAHSCCPISVVYRTAFCVGGLGQHFHHLQHRIRQPGAEHEALVFRKPIHTVQNPFHVVIPLRQSDWQVGRGQAFLAKKFALLRRNQPL